MLLPGGSSEIRCVKPPAQYLVLTDVIFLPSFIFRLTLTPFRWGITSAQRIHALRFFIHGCWVGWLFHASLMSRVGVENYGPVCWPQWTQVEGLQFSPPSSGGVSCNLGGWLHCPVSQKRAVLGTRQVLPGLFTWKLFFQWKAGWSSSAGRALQPPVSNAWWPELELM